MNIDNTKRLISMQVKIPIKNVIRKLSVLPDLHAYDFFG